VSSGVCRGARGPQTIAAATQRKCWRNSAHAVAYFKATTRCWQPHASRRVGVPECRSRRTDNGHGSIERLVAFGLQGSRASVQVAGVVQRGRVVVRPLGDSHRRVVAPPTKALRFRFRLVSKSSTREVGRVTLFDRAITAIGVRSCGVAIGHHALLCVQISQPDWLRRSYSSPRVLHRTTIRPPRASAVSRRALLRSEAST